MQSFITINTLKKSLFVLACCGAQLFAATVAEILGTRNALQCYSSGLEIRCRELLTGQDWKVMDRVKAAKQHWTGSINAGGTRLVCEDNRWVCVVNLDGSNKQFVAGPRMTNGHFFRDSLGNDWVVYTGEEESYRQAGTTWMVQIDNANKAIDSTRTLLLGEQYSCGMNGTGTYFGDVFANAYLYNAATKKKSPVLYDTTSWWEPECIYGSMHPGAYPWLMFSIDTLLHTIVIAQWIEATNQRRFVWQYSHPTGTAFALWSSTDSTIASLVKERQLYLLAITPDVSGTADNQGSYTEATTGLTFTSDTSLVGRPWVGTRAAVAGTPIINPPAGAYADDSVTISITSITDSAAIYYTVNGTVPTESSTVYAAPFSLPVPDTGSIILTARAFQSGMTESPVASAAFSRLTLNEAIALSAEVENGLTYEYYEGYFVSLTDIFEPWALPIAVGTTDSFHISMSEREEQFALRFAGYFKAPADGKYTFHIVSDDSSRLSIDSTLVVATNYLLAERSGSIGLKAGLHPIELLYHQGDGGNKLFVDYEGPQITKTVLSSAQLFREKQLIKISSPNAYDTVLVGQALPIQWTADASITSVLIDITADKGQTWLAVISTALASSSAQWGNYSWPIPAQLSTHSLHNMRISIRVRSAANAAVADVSDHTLHIMDPASIRKDTPDSKRVFAIRHSAAALKIDIPYSGWHRLTLMALDGRILARHESPRAKTYAIHTRTIPAGLYLVNVQTGQGIINRAVTIVR